MKNKIDSLIAEANDLWGAVGIYGLYSPIDPSMAQGLGVSRINVLYRGENHSIQVFDNYLQQVVTFSKAKTLRKKNKIYPHRGWQLNKLTRHLAQITAARPNPWTIQELAYCLEDLQGEILNEERRHRAAINKQREKKERRKINEVLIERN